MPPVLAKPRKDFSADALFRLTRSKVDPNHWTVFCRFLASEILLGISLVPVTQA